MQLFPLKIPVNTVLIMILFFFCSCQTERYRTDRRNRLTKKAEQASDYLAKQSIELTQENIENKEKNRRRARRRLERLQRALNELNAQSKKEKTKGSHQVEFKFY